jgi:hypothetical protein
MRHSNKTANFVISRAALGCVLGVSMLLAVAPARAADDDDDAKAPLDTQIMRKIMSGLGLKRDGDLNGINYQERAPLVIPPGLSSLPPPEKSGAAVVNNPAWPVDPDVKRKKQAVAEERRTRLNADQQILHDQSVLSPDQLTPGPKPRTAPRQTQPGTASPYGYSNQSTPSELGYKGNIFSNMFAKDKDDEVGQFTGEQARTSLTAPPPGYQTPSPDQPYGVTKAKEPAPKAGDYLLNHPVGIQ